jgi:hypothetical protein
MGPSRSCIAAAALVALAGCTLKPFRSEVPILKIDTHGHRIPKDPKVEAELVVHFDPRESTQTFGSRTDYRGGIGIELLGHSSLHFRKKSYALKLRDSQGHAVAAPLLGLPPDSNWVLHGPYSDKTLMRNYLAYALAGRLHLASPRTRFVELFVRQNLWGETYQGVYLLVDASGRSPEALGIAPIHPGDTSEPAVSGGYIVQVDRVKGGASYFTLRGDPMSPHPDTIIFVSPERPAPAQKTWLAAYFDSMEAALPPARSLGDPSGYARYLDVDSFVDFLLLQEVVKNTDAYRFSASMYKDRGGKLRMGPVWDFDLATGNVARNDGCDTDGWMLQFLGKRHWDQVPPRWWRALLEDRAFRDRLQSRWQELRAGPLSTGNVLALIDSAAFILRGAQQRNFQRWHVLGTTIWNNCPIPGSNPPAYYATWEDEVVYLRSWMEGRLRWMDDHIATIALYEPR